jgi:hypothetical protein
MSFATPYMVSPMISMRIPKISGVGSTPILDASLDQVTALGAGRDARPSHGDVITRLLRRDYGRVYGAFEFEHAGLKVEKPSFVGGSLEEHLEVLSPGVRVERPSPLGAFCCETVTPAGTTCQ